MCKDISGFSMGWTTRHNLANYIYPQDVPFLGFKS